MDKKDKKEGNPLFKIHPLSKEEKESRKSHNKEMFAFFGAFFSLGSLLLIMIEFVFLKLLESLGLIKILI